jgi:hypothetical protein
MLQCKTIISIRTLSRSRPSIRIRTLNHTRTRTLTLTRTRLPRPRMAPIRPTRPGTLRL